MENVLNITQDEMNTVIDNEPQMPSSKIKLRSMSLANSKKHIKNVPHFSRKQLKDNDKEIVKEKEGDININWDEEIFCVKVMLLVEKLKSAEII